MNGALTKERYSCQDHDTISKFARWSSGYHALTHKPAMLLTFVSEAEEVTVLGINDYPENVTRSVAAAGS